MSIELKREDFLSQYPPLYYLNKEDVKDIWNKKEIHLYIHFPYCTKKCGFCYYKSFPVGNNGIPQDYLEIVKKEIELYGKLPEVQSKKVRSIYLGGGTPTLMTEQQFTEMITHIHKYFHLSSEVELCCEANPGKETSYHKLSVLKELGLTRLSVGCQSLDDQVLEVNGRNHKSQTFYDCMERAKKADIFSVNVDIMSGMINQSLDSWLRTIDKICELEPENIAVYKLEIYLNNKLYSRIRKGEIQLISDAEEVEYARAGYQKILDHGYQFADNFSFMRAPQYDHTHRRDVWLGADMLGVGLSAHSCFNDFIYQNDSRMKLYRERIQQGQLPIFRARAISTREEMLQRIIFGIKNLEFDRKAFYNEFGVDPIDLFPDKFHLLQKKGFIKINPGVVNTTFEGAIFADDIVRLFYLPEHKKMMLAHVKRPAKSIISEVRER